MSFFVLICAAAAAAWAVSHLFRKLDFCASLRWGMAMGFLFTGVDHFLSASTRYAPMIPDVLADQALFWVYFTGVAELAGGVGLLVTPRLYARLGLPNLQKHAGIGLAAMLICVVAANVNVALKGQAVQGLEFGAWYYWIRPLFQPVFVVWALYCVGAWPWHKSMRLRPPNRVWGTGLVATHEWVVGALRLPVLSEKHDLCRRFRRGSKRG